jgi:hypothetical protein
LSQTFKTPRHSRRNTAAMSRFVLLARSPRAIEVAWVEADQTLRAAANECTPADAGDRSARAAPAPAHGGLPARTALWFWAESSELE